MQEYLLTWQPGVRDPSYRLAPEHEVMSVAVVHQTAFKAK